MQGPSSVKIIGVIQEVTLYPPHNQTLILPSLYGHDPKKVEEFAAEIQTFRMSRRGFVSGEGWEYKPSQDSSEYRIQFAFDRETKRIVNNLLEHAEAHGRNQKRAKIEWLEKENVELKKATKKLIDAIYAFNDSPWYKRIWITLFSQV